MKLVKLLLEMGAGPLDSFVDDSSYTPLCIASSV